MNRHIKRLILPFVLLSLFIMAGCKEKENSKELLVTDGVNFTELYNLENDFVLVKVNKEELTVGEVKEKAFKQALVSVVNEFVDRQLLLDEFNVSQKEVEQETNKQKEQLGELAKGAVFNKEELAYQLAYQKALDKLVSYTEKDLEAIYTQHYASSERSFDEMKEEIKRQAPFILGSQKIHEYQQSLRKKADITYFDESLNEFLGGQKESSN